MLNILRNLSTWISQVFQFVFMFRVESPRPWHPNTRESCSRAATLPPAAREGSSHGAQQAAEPRWRPRCDPGADITTKAQWRHTSALYTETRAGTILSSSITGTANYINANIRGVL